MRVATASAPAAQHATLAGRSQQPEGPSLAQRQGVGPAALAPATGACACGGGCPRCAAGTGFLQAKLEVSQPGDALELEADRVADSVTSGTVTGTIPAITPASSPPVQRACACGGSSEEDCACEEGADTPVQRKAVDTPRAPPAPVHLSHSAGEPMPASLREDFEARFGRSFADVRLHRDGAAGASARSFNSLAYTVGSDIVFGDAQYAPGSTAGRRLIAHELAHVVQQSHGGRAVQRFVPCTRARLSLEECPAREPTEVRDSQRSEMNVEYITAPEQGYLIWDFGVGQSRLKPGVTKHKNWHHLVQALSDRTTKWEMVGLSDCHGDDSLNSGLRDDRIDAVLGALPYEVLSQVVSLRAAPLTQCITDNTTRADRAANRSVLIQRLGQDIAFPAREVEGRRPVPRPQPGPTTDCYESEKKEIDAARPIAIAMVEKALEVLSRRRTPEIRALLKKYFNDPEGNWRIRAGFKNILEGLKSDTKIECEHKGSFRYDAACPASADKFTAGYVRTLVALRVHLCEAAFGRGDLDLADTLVHEFSHMFDLTNVGFGDEPYCWTGACSSLSRWDAYDNADSYSSFAAEAYIKL